MTQQNQRKKRDTTAIHNKILDGAITVFTESGFDAASMDRISEVADVSKRTVYNHFSSKEDLFKEIVLNFINQRDKIKEIEYETSKPISEQLRQFIDAELFLINDSKRRGLSKFLTSYFLIDISYAVEVQTNKHPHEHFIQWLQHAKEMGQLDFKSPTLAAGIFYGLVEGCLTWPALMSNGISLQFKEPLIDEIIVTFLNQYSV